MYRYKTNSLFLSIKHFVFFPFSSKSRKTFESFYRTKSFFWLKTFTSKLRDLKKAILNLFLLLKHSARAKIKIFHLLCNTSKLGQENNKCKSPKLRIYMVNFLTYLVRQKIYVFGESCRSVLQYIFFIRQNFSLRFFQIQRTKRNREDTIVSPHGFTVFFCFWLYQLKSSCFFFEEHHNFIFQN